MFVKSHSYTALPGLSQSKVARSKVRKAPVDDSVIGKQSVGKAKRLAKMSGRRGSFSSLDLPRIRESVHKAHGSLDSQEILAQHKRAKQTLSKLETKVRDLVNTEPERPKISDVFDHEKIGVVLPTNPVDHSSDIVPVLVKMKTQARLDLARTQTDFDGAKSRKIKRHKAVVKHYDHIVGTLSLLDGRRSSGLKFSKQAAIINNDPNMKALVKHLRAKNPKSALENRLLANLNPCNSQKKLMEGIKALKTYRFEVKSAYQSALRSIKKINGGDYPPSITQLVQSVNQHENDLNGLQKQLDQHKLKSMRALTTRLKSNLEKSAYRTVVMKRARDYAVHDFFKQSMLTLNTKISERMAALEHKESHGGGLSLDESKELQGLIEKQPQLQKAIRGLPTEVLDTKAIAQINTILSLPEFEALSQGDHLADFKGTFQKAKALASTTHSKLTQEDQLFSSMNERLTPGSLRTLNTKIKERIVALETQETPHSREEALELQSLIEQQPKLDELLRDLPTPLTLDVEKINQINDVISQPSFLSLSENDNLGTFKASFDGMVEVAGKANELVKHADLHKRISDYFTKEDIGFDDTDWELCKESFLNSSDHRSELYQKMMLDHRYNLTKQMLKGVGYALGIPVIMQGRDNDIVDRSGPHTVIKIVGSNELSSDIDVNVTVVNGDVGMDTEFVRLFNELSRDILANEMGNDSDVNLYTKGVFPDVKLELSGGDGKIDWDTNPAAKAKNEAGQDMISLVKIRKFAGDNWDQIVDGVSSELDARGVSPEKKRKIIKRYNQADRFYQETVQYVKLEKIRLKQQGEPYTSMNPKELELAANNRLYERHSREADELLFKYEVSGDLKYMAMAKTHLGKAHVYANEAALSEGVLKRVVVNEQMIPGMNKKIQELKGERVKVLEKFTEARTLLFDFDSQLEKVGGSNAVQEGLRISLKAKVDSLKAELDSIDEEIGNLKMTDSDVNPLLELSEAELLQSFNENFGDTLKEISHHSDDVAVAAYRSIKYVGRLARDMELMLEKLGQKHQPDPIDYMTVVPTPDALKGIISFINTVGKVEGYKLSSDQKNNSLLAIRKDRIGGDYPLKPNSGESMKAAKKRLATDLMKQHDFMVQDPDDVPKKLKSVEDFVTDMITLSSQFNTFVRNQIMD